MIYECKVYSPSGKLEKVHNPKVLKKRFWKDFYKYSDFRISSKDSLDESGEGKPKPSRAQLPRPKPCAWCKNPFTPSNPKVKTCCEKCKKQYLNDYFKQRRQQIKKGLLIAKRRGPSRRKNVARI